MPVISVVIPRLKTNQLKWSFTGAFEVCPFDFILFYVVFKFSRFVANKSIIIFTCPLKMLIYRN